MTLRIQHEKGKLAWLAPWSVPAGLAVFAASVTFMIVGAAAQVWLLPPHEEAIFAASLSANLLLVSVLYRRVLARSGEEFAGIADSIDLGRRCREAGLLVLAAILGSWVIRFVMDPASYFSVQFRASPPPLGVSWISDLLLGPLVEEITFRWVLYRTLRGYVGVAAAVLISSCLFTLIHVPDAQSAIIIFWLGVVLAVGAELFRNLGSLVVAHGAYNLLILLLETT